MKTAGYALIALSFLWGSLVAVQTSDNSVAWAWFWPALGLAAGGVLLARLASRSLAAHPESLKANHRQLREALNRIVLNLEQMEATQGELHPGDLHTRIDILLREDLSQFAEARKSIAHVYGLQAYAAIMNEFAAGERYVNRVWSASVDGYADEAWSYLGRAREQLVAAQRLLRELDGESAAK